MIDRTQIMQDETERAFRVAAGPLREQRALRDASPLYRTQWWRYHDQVRRLERAIRDIARVVERLAFERAILES